MVDQGVAAEQVARAQIEEGDLIAAGAQTEGAQLPLHQEPRLGGQGAFCLQDLAGMILPLDAVLLKDLADMGAELDVIWHKSAVLLPR